MTGLTFSSLLCGHGDVRVVCALFSCRRTELKCIPNPSLFPWAAQDFVFLCQHPETGLDTLLDDLRLLRRCLGHVQHD